MRISPDDFDNVENIETLEAYFIAVIRRSMEMQTRQPDNVFTRLGTALKAADDTAYGEFVAQVAAWPEE